MVLLIYQRGFETFEMGYASAIAYILFAIVLVLTILQFRMQSRWVHYEL
jgi:multiple sugar transport system permease protein